MANEVDTAIAFCRSKLGDSYVFGATGPDHYDCSGLMQKACAAAGVHIGRVTEEQILDGIGIPKGQQIPGDLIFPELTHVQMYTGNGMVIQSPHTGASVDEVPIGHVMAVRRVLSGGDESSAAGSAGGGTTSTVGLTNPLDDLAALGKAIGYLSQLSFWKRVGLWLLGTFIIVAAIVFLKRKTIVSGAESVGKVAEVAAVV